MTGGFTMVVCQGIMFNEELRMKNWRIYRCTMFLIFNIWKIDVLPVSSIKNNSVIIEHP